MTGLGLMLPANALASTAAEQLGEYERQVLEVLVELYGRELAAELYAVGVVESNLDPDAIGDGGISRGAWQVNVNEWGPAAAPMGARAGATRIERIRMQARAMRPVVEDKKVTAAEISRETGSSPAEALNLVWQFGATRARQIVGLAVSLGGAPLAVIRWSASVVASRIAAIKDNAFAALWLTRDAAFRAAYEAAVRVLSGLSAPLLATAGAAYGAAATITGILLLVFLYYYLKGKSRA